MTQSVHQPSPRLWDQAKQGLINGGAIMLMQTPIVTALNRISVVCCHNNLGMRSSIGAIYYGRLDQVHKPSIFHFFRGVSGHLMKEVSRLGFKTFGLMGKPSLDAYFHEDSFGTVKSDCVFAGGLSLAEMLINPTDTIRTIWQAGKRVSCIAKEKLFIHLYKGAGANGLRQFGTWLIFPLSERIWTRVIEKHTSVDAHGMSGIALKAIPQSLMFTTPVWMFERLKNELQYHSNLNDLERGKFRYAVAFKHILRTQGCRGFVRGFVPKVISNACLAMGADYLLELGRKAKRS